MKCEKLNEICFTTSEVKKELDELIKNNCENNCENNKENIVYCDWCGYYHKLKTNGKDR